MPHTRLSQLLCFVCKNEKIADNHRRFFSFGYCLFDVDPVYTSLKLLGASSAAIRHSTTNEVFRLVAFHGEDEQVRVVREIALLSWLPPCKDIISLAFVEKPRDDPTSASVYEYLANVEYTLSDFLPLFGELLTAEHVKRFATQILRGLHHLHSHGVIHGALSHSCVFLSQQSWIEDDKPAASPQPKLDDDSFVCIGGLQFYTSCDATNGDGVPEDAHCVATGGPVSPDFCDCTAPEVGTKQSGVTTASDMYSFGMICCVLLCGDFLSVEPSGLKGLWKFAKTDKQALRMFMLNGKEPTLHDTEFMDIIDQCMHPNPEERPTTAQLLSHPWFGTSTAMNNNTVTPKQFKPAWTKQLNSLTAAELHTLVLAYQNHYQNVKPVAQQSQSLQCLTMDFLVAQFEDISQFQQVLPHSLFAQLVMRSGEPAAIINQQVGWVQPG
eukprot:TRINITY_DN54069_c0_g1_i1.p1 TRINITY_DN54069_c0_g1~~TRINITY_DN54069_c0_g1_i1.p1  ORF type:complete len:439 (+),score=19.09 TRINITY_DN54069_c0_g1_i1:42-1358(+)